MSFGLLNNYREVTRQIESKLKSSQASLHNLRQYVQMLISSTEPVGETELQLIQKMTRDAAEALDEVTQ